MNPREGLSRNPQSQGKSELSPKGNNSQVPAGQLQRRSDLAPKWINSEVPAKAKRDPQEGISGNCQSQGRSELVPKGSNSEVPAGQLQQRSELAPKGINSEVTQENVLPMEFDIQIWVLNFRCVVEYFNIWRDRWSFARFTFLQSHKSGNKVDVAKILKTLCPIVG